MATAQHYGLRLILPLLNYGAEGGGVRQYQLWASLGKQHHVEGGTIDAEYAEAWHAETGDCPRFCKPCRSNRAPTLAHLATEA